MNEYFHLQYRIFNRRIRDVGLNPVIGWLLLFLVHTGVSMAIFYKIPFPQYFYVCVPIYFIINLSNNARTDFLKICFPRRIDTIVRIIENLLIAFPFVIFLMYKEFYLMSIILTVLAMLLATVRIKTPSIVAIPTPFWKHPYEFASGFRKTFPLFLLSYGLMPIAFVVNNFNLGIATLVLNTIVICSFYLYKDNIHYVWQFAMNPAQFLFYKTKVAIVYSLWTNAPAILALCIFKHELTPVVLVCVLLGLMYLTLSIMIKYDAFPEEPNISGAVVMIVCLMFPPLLTVMIPYMSNQAAKQLKHILNP